MLSSVKKPSKNHIQESTGRKVFRVVNVIILSLLALLCLLPFVNVIAISFSNSFYVDCISGPKGGPSVPIPTS